jgi:hypothetical protein
VTNSTSPLQYPLYTLDGGLSRVGISTGKREHELGREAVPAEVGSERRGVPDRKAECISGSALDFQDNGGQWPRQGVIEVQRVLYRCAGDFGRATTLRTGFNANTSNGRRMKKKGEEHRSEEESLGHRLQKQLGQRTENGMADRALLVAGYPRHRRTLYQEVQGCLATPVNPPTPTSADLEQGIRVRARMCDSRRVVS